jgi:hypothetical protein
MCRYKRCHSLSVIGASIGQLRTMKYITEDEAKEEVSNGPVQVLEVVHLVHCTAVHSSLFAVHCTIACIVSASIVLAYSACCRYAALWQ